MQSLTWCQDGHWALAGFSVSKSAVVVVTEGQVQIKCVPNLQGIHWVREDQLLLLREFGLPSQLVDSHLNVLFDNVPSSQNAWCFSDDGNLFYTCSASGELRIYETIHWSTVHKEKLALPAKCGPIMSLSMSDSDMLVVSDLLQFVGIANVTGKSMRALPLGSGELLLAPPQFSPRSEYLAVSCASNVRVFRAINGREVFVSKDRPSGVEAVVLKWNSSGTMILEIAANTCKALLVARGEEKTWAGSCVGASWSEADPSTLGILFASQVMRITVVQQQEEQDEVAILNLPKVAAKGRHTSIHCGENDILVTDGSSLLQTLF